MADDKNTDKFLDEAYRLKDKSSMVAFYEKWADDYDQMLDNLHYLSPRLIGELLIEHLADKQSIILDVGCGTGLTSVLLHENGFQTIDGLDFSADMLRVSRQRGIYRNLIEADLNQPLSLADEQYHAAISSGTFTHGHVGPEPLDEIFRILKPGGLFACTIHDALWQNRGFEQKIEQLLADDVISCLVRKLDCYFEGNEPEGWFCLYRKQ